MLHKKFADTLNVVIILKENQQTGKIARIILFSTDLNLEPTFRTQNFGSLIFLATRSRHLATF